MTTMVDNVENTANKTTKYLNFLIISIFFCDLWLQKYE